MGLLNIERGKGTDMGQRASTYSSSLRWGSQGSETGPGSGDEDGGHYLHHLLYRQLGSHPRAGEHSPKVIPEGLPALARTSGAEPGLSTDQVVTRTHKNQRE